MKHRASLEGQPLRLRSGQARGGCPHMRFSSVRLLSATHISLVIRHKTVVKCGLRKSCLAMMPGSVTHNVLAPRSFRSEVLHGRSGPCRVSFCFSAVILPASGHQQALRRPWRVGSHGLRNFRAGSFRRSGLFLFGLHRSLIECPAVTSGRARPRNDLKVYSTKSLKVCRSGFRKAPSPAALFQRATMSGLRSYCRAKHPAFPHS